MNISELAARAADITTERGWRRSGLFDNMQTGEGRCCAVGAAHLAFHGSFNQDKAYHDKDPNYLAFLAAIADKVLPEWRTQTWLLDDGPEPLFSHPGQVVYYWNDQLPWTGGQETVIRMFRQLALEAA